MLHICTERDIFLNIHLDMQRYAFAIPVHVLYNLGSTKKTFFLTHPLLSSSNFNGVNISLLVIFLC